MKKTIAICIWVCVSMSIFGQTYGPNPSVKYAELLGYQTIKNGERNSTDVILPDGKIVDSWKFYRGQEGKKHSYCSKYGMKMKIKFVKYGKSKHRRIYCVDEVNKIEKRLDDLLYENGDYEYLYGTGAPPPEDSIPVPNDSIVPPPPDIDPGEPLFFDWRNVNGVNYVTPVKDQGSWRYQWQRWSIGFQNYLVGEMKEVFSSGLSTLEMVNWQRVISGSTIRLPWAEQKGNLTEREELQPFSPRLLFYRGMQEDSNGDPYPMGSNDNKDINGDPIPGKSLSLVWKGDSGVYNQLWKDYLTWWMNRKQVNWMIQDPSTLDFSEKYAIDRNHYLLKKRTIIFTLHDIQPAECEFYLV